MPRLDYHEYSGVRIPILTGKSARAAYNLPDDEIDRMRGDLPDDDWNLGDPLDFSTGCNFTPEGSCMEPGGFRGTDFSAAHAYLDEQECKERARDLERGESSIFHLFRDNNVPVKNQNGHGYCWAYGAISALEANLLVQGFPYVELSPHSVAAGYMKGADRGGWASWALKWTNEHGIVPDSLWPKHSRNHRLWNQAEIAEAAAKYKPKEWVDVPNGDMPALRSLLADNKACGMGLMWWGHLIMFGLITWSDRYGWLYGQRNSHGPNFGNDGWCFHTEASARHGGGSTVLVA